MVRPLLPRSLGDSSWPASTRFEEIDFGKSLCCRLSDDTWFEFLFVAGMLNRCLLCRLLRFENWRESRCAQKLLFRLRPNSFWTPA